MSRSLPSLLSSNNRHTIVSFHITRHSFTLFSFCAMLIGITASHKIISRFPRLSNVEYMEFCVSGHEENGLVFFRTGLNNGMAILFHLAGYLTHSNETVLARILLNCASSSFKTHISHRDVTKLVKLLQNDENVWNLGPEISSGMIPVFRKAVKLGADVAIRRL